MTLRAALNPADFRLDNSPQRLSNSCPSPRAGSQSMVVSCLGGGPGWLSTLPLFPSWRSPSLTSERAGLPAYELMSPLTSMSKITSSMSGKVNFISQHWACWLDFPVIRDSENKTCCVLCLHVFITCPFLPAGLRKHDVCFLITVRPNLVYGTRFDRRQPFLEQTGVAYVRGCEVQGMLDERGRVIEEGALTSTQTHIHTRRVSFLLLDSQ